MAALGQPVWGCQLSIFKGCCSQVCFGAEAELLVLHWGGSISAGISCPRSLSPQQAVPASAAQPAGD